MKNRLTKQVILGLLFVVGLGLLFKGTYIQAKAILAQYLIEDAWEETIKTSTPQKPWSWADTKVIMKMYVPRLDEELYILEGDSGASLAFGPGHSTQSFMPKDDGTVMISAHNDTHFNFLKNLNKDDEVVIQDSENNFHIYKMNQAKILDVNKDKLTIYDGKKELVLVTCYPFDVMEFGGSKRYIVNLGEVS